MHSLDLIINIDAILYVTTQDLTNYVPAPNRKFSKKVPIFNIMFMNFKTLKAM